MSWDFGARRRPLCSQLHSKVNDSVLSAISGEFHVGLVKLVKNVSVLCEYTLYIARLLFVGLWLLNVYLSGSVLCFLSIVIAHCRILFLLFFF